jgi:hypothetical protein
MSKYTYTDFAQEAVTLATGGTIADVERFITKANALAATHANKAAYNRANPKKTASKGASEETMTKANAIAEILTADTPLTAADICEQLGVEWSALQVANAVKFIEGAQSTKVVRDAIGKNGLKAEKQYTAYTRG